MKITKTYLKQIIKEELQRVMEQPQGQEEPEFANPVVLTKIQTVKKLKFLKNMADISFKEENRNPSHPKRLASQRMLSATRLFLDIIDTEAVARRDLILDTDQGLYGLALKFEKNKMDLAAVKKEMGSIFQKIDAEIAETIAEIKKIKPNIKNEEININNEDLRKFQAVVFR